MTSRSFNVSRKGRFVLYGTDLIGMIRARKLAIKIKKRAQFLVAYKRHRDNMGKAILVHHDIPVGSFAANLGYPSLRHHSAEGLSASFNCEKNAGGRHEHKMMPDEIFPALSIEKEIREMLQARLHGTKYTPAICKELSKSLSEEIKQAVKTTHRLTRYKLISVVHIGETLNKASARFGSRCLWDVKFDNFASSFYQNSCLYAVATVFAVYYE